MYMNIYELLSVLKFNFFVNVNVRPRSCDGVIGCIFIDNILNNHGL